MVVAVGTGSMQGRIYIERGLLVIGESRGTSNRRVAGGGCEAYSAGQLWLGLLAGRGWIGR